MQYYTTMKDLTDEVRHALESSDGKYDIEAIAYEVARTRETQRLDQPAFYITEDEDEFWDAAMRHALD